MGVGRKRKEVIRSNNFRLKAKLNGNSKNFAKYERDVGEFLAATG